MAYTEQLINEIATLYQGGLSREKVAKQLNIPEGSISYILKKHNIPMRPRGFQLGNDAGVKFTKEPDIFITCKNCPKQVRIWKSKVSGPNQRKYCSERCRSQFNSRKERHWNWQGGIVEPRPERHTLEYKAWRLSVFTRDNFKCQECPQIGGKLQAHHIQQWMHAPDLRYDLDNGITLCQKCHNKPGRHKNRRHR